MIKAVYKINKQNMYLSNKELYVEIIISKAQGRLTRRAQGMLELLGKKTIKKMRYWNREDQLDCLQSGLLDMFANWYNFNEDKSRNPFAYFTEVFKRGMTKTFNKLYKVKGSDDENPIKIFSIDSINDGQGMHNI